MTAALPFGSWPPGYQAAVIAGNYPGYRASVQAMAAAAVVTIPGPPAGMLRALEVQIVALAASTVSAVLKPSDLQLSRNVVVPATGTQLILSQRPWVVAQGETIEVANTGANPFNLFVAYYDFPASGCTPFRGTAGLTPVEIVPAAPAGFARQLLPIRVENTISLIGSQPCIYGYNDDTVGHDTSYYLGGVLFARQVITTAGAPFSIPTGPGVVLVTVDAISIGTRVAPTTRPINFFGVYTTFPVAP